MNDKKNIERFFQEKFKDFEVNPKPMAWDSIFDRINKKKKKKNAFPIWFKSIGIAASLIIGYLLYNLNNSNTNKILLQNNQNIIVAKPTTNDQNIKIDSTIKVANKLNNDKNNIVASVNDINSKNLNPSQNDKIFPKSNNDKNNIVASADDKKSIRNTKNRNGLKPITENQVAENTSKKESGENKATKKNENNNYLQQKINTKDEIALNDKLWKIKQSQKNNSVQTNENNIVKNQFVKDEITINKRDVAFNENKTKEKNSSENEKNQEIKSDIILDNPINNNKIAEIVIEKSNDIKPVLAENTLDKILEEKLEKTKKKAIKINSEKWTIRPNVAPIFMKAFTGSPIHDIFADNEKDFKNQLSIGLAADYAISKKISIRAGINKFDLAYNTNDVAFYADPTLTTTSLNTINFRPETQNLVVNDRKARGTNVGNIPQIAENGIINQSFGYLEFPVEVSYKLIDKKFGVTLITGLSTLLLNKNEVSLTSDSRKFVLGDANNLNNIHFSTNIGIGFKYKFLKSFEANVEPTLKYQIDTFSYDAGGFNPYFLGIYSGISYRL